MDDRTFFERLSDWKAREAAARQAVREAVLQHAVVGRSVPTWRDGQVVWLTPDEIFALYGLKLVPIESTQDQQ